MDLGSKLPGRATCNCGAAGRVGNHLQHLDPVWLNSILRDPSNEPSLYNIAVYDLNRNAVHPMF